MIEYTEEMYLQVNKLIKYFLKKYMSRCAFLNTYFDDLYSDCFFLFQSRYFKYIEKNSLSLVIKYCVMYAVQNFFRILKTDKKKLSYIDNCVSLDAIFSDSSDKSDDKDSLNEIFGKDFDYDEFFNYNYLLSLCNEAIKNEKSSNKKIMQDIIAMRKPTEIAKKYDVSKQFVYRCCEKLKMLVFLKLKQNNYDSDYLKNYKPDIEKIPFKYREEIKKYL